jgi:hypothetical protein
LRLSCICSALRDIVHPSLFRSTFVYFRNTGADNAFANLVNTFRQRALLAKNVKHLLLTSEPTGYQAEDNKGRVEFPKLALPMLASMVNVTTLHFQSSRLETTPHLGQLLSNKPIANNGQLHLPNLIALFVNPSNPTEMVCIADFVPIFGHSRLKRISIDAGVLLDTLLIWRLHETSQLSPGNLHASELNLIRCLLDRKLA